VRWVSWSLTSLFSTNMAILETKVRWVKFILSHMLFISKSTNENCIKIRWSDKVTDKCISWLLFMAHGVRPTQQGQRIPHCITYICLTHSIVLFSNHITSFLYCMLSCDHFALCTFHCLFIGIRHYDFTVLSCIMLLHI